VPEQNLAVIGVDRNCECEWRSGKAHQHILPGFYLFETRVNEDDLDSDDSRECGVVIRDNPVSGSRQTAND
jgi:hypothetical protein